MATHPAQWTLKNAPLICLQKPPFLFYVQHNIFTELVSAFHFCIVLNKYMVTESDLHATVSSFYVPQFIILWFINHRFLAPTTHNFFIFKIYNWI